MPFCSNCGAEVNEKQDVCLKCGCRVNVLRKTDENVSNKRILAAALAIFLGGLGVHKFYLGRPFQGFFYLIFCFTFIPAIIGFIEGIIYLCMSDEEFAAKYR